MRTSLLFLLLSASISRQQPVLAAAWTRSVAEIRGLTLCQNIVPMDRAGRFLHVSKIRHLAVLFLGWDSCRQDQTSYSATENESGLGALRILPGEFCKLRESSGARGGVGRCSIAARDATANAVKDGGQSEEIESEVERNPRD